MVFLGQKGEIKEKKIVLTSTCPTGASVSGKEKKSSEEQGNKKSKINFRPLRSTLVGGEVMVAVVYLGTLLGFLEMIKFDRSINRCKPSPPLPVLEAFV